LRFFGVRQSESFGFYEHVHQIDESDDAQNKQSCKHFSSDFFKPIHTFRIKPVTQRPEGAQQQEQHSSIHLRSFFELDNNFVKPQSIRHSNSIAPQNIRIRITITMSISSFGLCPKEYEGSAKTGISALCD